MTSIDNDDAPWFDEVFVGDGIHVDIEYEYQPPSHSDHPYGEGYAREDHPASLDICAVILKSPAELMDDDGNPSGKFIAAGTDLMNEKFWSKPIDSAINDWVWNQLID